MATESPPATPSQAASIDQILHAGWYLLELINEILDLAAVESGKLSMSVEPVSLAEVLLECQAMIDQQAQKRGHTLTFPPLDSSRFVLADRIRLKQILLNLLSNALKYTGPAGTVVVECTSSAPDRTRVAVRDTGPGLPPEKLAQLFQPFNRLGQEDSPEEGTGIGLVMSKLLVEMMGGVIGVESVVGKGSLFWFELSSAAATGPGVELPAPRPAVDVRARQDAPVRTLLHVEDNAANLQLVEQLLARRPDIRLLSAKDGHVGIELARSALPDVILMDLNLPGIGGLQAMQILRTDPSTTRIPVIAISANAMAGDVRRGLDHGFLRYLTKPIHVEEFMDAIDAALEVAASPSDTPAREGGPR